MALGRLAPRELHARVWMQPVLAVARDGSFPSRADPGRFIPHDGGEDVPAGHLDGLRISRNLSRMRSLEAQIEAEPLRTWRQYRARWVKLLGKEGGGFRWHDRTRAIKWKKYGGMRRVDFMLCQVLDSLEQDHPEFARAQVVQCMKCLHEFSRHGSWKASGPLTHMVDPWDLDGHGGDDVEMEVIMSWLRTKDDLRRKVDSGRAVANSVSDNDEEAGDPAAPDEEEAQRRARPGRKAKPKPKATGAVEGIARQGSPGSMRPSRFAAA